MECEDEFDMRVPDKDIEKLRTVGDATAHVEKHPNEQAPSPGGPDLSGGAHLLDRMFRYVLVWTVFWLFLAAAIAVRLWQIMPRRIPLESTSLWYPLGMVACAGALAVGAMVRQMGATEELKAAYIDAECQGIIDSAMAWLGASLFGVPCMFLAVVLLAGVAPGDEIGPRVGLVIAAFFFFTLSLFFWHLRVGQLCGIVGAFSNCTLLENHARQVVRNWRVLLVETGGLPVVGGYLTVRSGETAFLWIVVLVWLLFVVYCHVCLAVLLRRTVCVLERAGTGRR